MSRVVFRVTATLVGSAPGLQLSLFSTLRRLRPGFNLRARETSQRTENLRITKQMLKGEKSKADKMSSYWMNKDMGLQAEMENSQAAAEKGQADIMETIRKNGYTVSTMGEAAKKFIANWESEKYRKSLAGKKG